MNYRITGRSITVIINNKAYVRDFNEDLAAACRANDENLVLQHLGIDPLLDPYKDYGGGVQGYFLIKNSRGQYWREPRKGVTDKREEAYCYPPDLVRSVIGRRDEVTVERP